MRTETIKIFSFDELNIKAQNNALQYQKENQEYFFGYEAIKSFEALARIVNVKIINYQIDWLDPHNSFLKHDDTNIIKNSAFDINAELTGFFTDYSIVREWNATRSIERTFQKLLWDCCADYEEQLTDDSIEDYLINNSYEFLEDGSIYKK